MSWVGEAGNSNYLEVELSERSPKGLRVASPRPVPVDEKVWLILPSGVDYQGLVDGCQRTHRGFRVGVRFLGKQRPASQNQDLGTARLKWLDESGSLGDSGVFIQNSGDGELEVWSAEPVPSPSIVLLSGYELQGLASARTLPSRRQSLFDQRGLAWRALSKIRRRVRLILTLPSVAPPLGPAHL